MSDEGLRESWLANWLITERVTGLGGSRIQLTQSDTSAHGLIVIKEITHTNLDDMELQIGYLLSGYGQEEMERVRYEPLLLTRKINIRSKRDLGLFLN